VSRPFVLSSIKRLQPSPNESSHLHPTPRKPSDVVQVLQAREAFLSDYEVYQQISESSQHSRRKGSKDQPGSLQTIQLEVPLSLHEVELIVSWKIISTIKLHMCNTRPKNQLQNSSPS